MTTHSSTSFYSDQIQLPDDIKGEVFAPLAREFSTPLTFYVQQLEAHIDAVKQAAVKNIEVKELRVAWSPATKKVSVYGTKPWSAEKIAEFEGAAKSEKTEVEQLRSLITKHPKKAIDAIGYLLESQKLETIESAK
jgi:hypothetical protein